MPLLLWYVCTAALLPAIRIWESGVDMVVVVAAQVFQDRLSNAWSNNDFCILNPKCF